MQPPLTPQQLKDYKKQLSKGIPAGEIKNEMLANGYSQADIQKVFEPHFADMRSWFLICSIIFAVSGLIQLLQTGELLFLKLAAGSIIAYLAAVKAYQNHQKSKTNT